MAKSVLSDIKYKLEETLWFVVHNGSSPTREERIKKLYSEYREAGGKSTLSKLRSAQFHK